MDNREFEADAVDGGGIAERSAPSRGQRIVAVLKKNHIFWIPVIAVAMILILVLTLVLIASSSDEKSDRASQTSEVSVPSEVDVSKDLLLSVDSDGDGLPDQIEIGGWKTSDGSVYRTDPQLPDTDDDGLSDGEEAGEILTGGDGDVIYAGITNPLKADSDDDGLDDKVEIDGWQTRIGDHFVTDPMNSDTDSDGIPDGIEAGSIIRNSSLGVFYRGVSNPLEKDTDGDGLSDAEEMDNGTDPYVSDTDDDGLNDYYEVKVIGTDPQSVDSDGDGFDDKYEDGNRKKTLPFLSYDPLFKNEKFSLENVGEDFAVGAVFGDFMPRDSIPWLIGNLSVVSLSLIPVLGDAVLLVADIRDAVANAKEGDQLNAGLSMIGQLAAQRASPVGDVANASAKVSKFVARNPHLKERVGGAVVGSRFLPERIQLPILRSLWAEWDDLILEGANKKAIKRLISDGRLNIKKLSDDMKRPGHVRGQPVSFIAEWNHAEYLLEKNLKRRHADVKPQVYVKVEGCTLVCNTHGRFIDVLADKVAHESKVGYVTLTPGIMKQIQTDAHFVRTGVITESHWHFYPSGITGQMGASKQVLDLLEAEGIKFTNHVPKI